MKEIKLYLTNDELNELIFILILAEMELNDKENNKLRKTLTKIFNILQKYQ